MCSHDQPVEPKQPVGRRKLEQVLRTVCELQLVKRVVHVQGAVVVTHKELVPQLLGCGYGKMWDISKPLHDPDVDVESYGLVIFLVRTMLWAHPWLVHYFFQKLVQLLPERLHHVHRHWSLFLCYWLGSLLHISVWVVSSPPLCLRRAPGTAPGWCPVPCLMSDWVWPPDTISAGSSFTFFLKKMYIKHTLFNYKLHIVDVPDCLHTLTRLVPPGLDCYNS